MSIKIDTDLCVGCGGCIEACPGNLIKFNEDNTAFIKYPKDCWGCSSCIKECGVQAIKYYLGADIAGSGSVASTKEEGDITYWIIKDKYGTEEIIEVNKKNANAY